MNSSNQASAVGNQLTWSKGDARNHIFAVTVSGDMRALFGDSAGYLTSDSAFDSYRGRYEERWRCWLCHNTAALSTAEMNAHCVKEEHQQALAAANAKNQSAITILNRWEEAQSLQERVSRLAFGVWKWDVQTKLCEFMLDKQSSGTSEQVLAKLLNYERIGPICLLELAVWKASCLMQFNEKTAIDYLSVLDWQRNGWKQWKPAMRNSNSIVIVMKSVLPFLKEQLPEPIDT